MKVDVDVLSPVRRRIRVELPAESVDREFARTCQALGRRVKIRGFRPGKAPLSVLRGIYGNEIRSEVVSRLVESSLQEIVKACGLEVVSRPEVEAGDFAEAKPFSFTAVLEVKPDIELKAYLGIELEKRRRAIGEAEVEAALRQFLESHAHLEPVEDRDVVKRGDFVEIDYAGSVDGKPMAEGKVESTLVEVGGGRALPQFEEALIGLQKDREHTISFAYPENYSDRELAGKKADFRVVVREIKRKVLPPLDDEFAKDYGECASLEELREKVRARLESELEEIQKRELEEQLLDRLLAAHAFEVPQAMVEAELRYLSERRQRGLRARGLGRLPGLDELRRELEPQALRQAKAGLLIERIAAQEKIKVSDEELGRRIEEMARSARENAALVRDYYRRAEAREELRSRMLFERTLEFLLERAQVKEIEPTVDAREKKS